MVSVGVVLRLPTFLEALVNDRICALNLVFYETDQ